MFGDQTIQPGPTLSNSEIKFGGAQVHSRALFGLQAHAVQVECHISSGSPSTTIVGLPQGSVREARDRVRSALRHLGFEYPDARVVINLAPAEISKTGTGLDLPIAMSLLAASGQISTEHLSRFEFIGELGLFGELRGVQGVVGCVLAAAQCQRITVLPIANASEVQVLAQSNICVAHDLAAVTRILNDGETTPAPAPVFPPQNRPQPNEVVGQQAAKRALQIAAAGGHHLLMVGPPGTGKTLLAQNLRCLLPDLDEPALIEVAQVYSASGLARDDYQQPPFRSPHHSASNAALVGGGSPPNPGEFALAHNGVLFLDELPHFTPSALNLLREPLESGEALISRAAYKIRYPSRFQLIAAMNPCPVGRSCRADACRCDPGMVKRYQGRISGPILDRIDLHMSVPELEPRLLRKLKDRAPTDWDLIKQQVNLARDTQLRRQGRLNAELGLTSIQTEMQRASVDKHFLDQAIARYQLSARSYHKLWRIARTIADITATQQDSDEPDDMPIEHTHMVEALRYRAMDWEHGVS